MHLRVYANLLNGVSVRIRIVEKFLRYFFHQTIRSIVRIVVQLTSTIRELSGIVLVIFLRQANSEFVYIVNQKRSE